MRVEISGATIAEIKAKLREFLEALGEEYAEAVAEVVPYVAAPGAAEKGEEPKPAAVKKPGKKKDAKTAEVPKTKQDAVEVLIKVNTKFGIEKAKELLGSFGCEKMSELPEEKFTEFVKVCETALA